MSLQSLAIVRLQMNSDFSLQEKVERKLIGRRKECDQKCLKAPVAMFYQLTAGIV